MLTVGILGMKVSRKSAKGFDLGIKIGCFVSFLISILSSLILKSLGFGQFVSNSSLGVRTAVLLINVLGMGTETAS